MTLGPLTRRNIQQLFEQIDQFAAEIEGQNTSRIASQLYEFLERRRSPYRDEEIHEIENQLEIPLLQTAADTLFSGITRGDAIQIVATYGIDSYCAAHIIHQTLEGYLECNVDLQLLPSGVSEPDSVQSLDRSHSGITVLVGDFEFIPETGAPILIGGRNNGVADENRGVNLLQLTQGAASVCQCPAKESYRPETVPASVGLF